ncbi:MAG: hypothetical protein V4603_18725 [Pseudomonadota bacterium]
MQVIKTTPQKHLLIYCLAAVVPLMAMALLFNIPLATNGRFFPGTDLDVLGYLIHSEFLAAASGVFPLIPLLINIKSRKLRWLPKILFIFFGFICAGVAHTLAGTAGMLFYVLQVFLTYGGGTLFIFDWLFGVTRTFLTLLRWSVALFVYVSLQLNFDLGTDFDVWRNTREGMMFGAMYFYILCLMEVVLYPPLTWYLEYRLKDEQRYSVALDGFGRAVRD